MLDLGFNRDHAHIWIDDEGFLQVDDKHKYCLEYIRVGYSDGVFVSDIIFVDPTGGPFIHVGDFVGEKKVKSIECVKGQGFKILFSEDR